MPESIPDDVVDALRLINKRIAPRLLLRRQTTDETPAASSPREKVRCPMP